MAKTKLPKHRQLVHQVNVRMAQIDLDRLHALAVAWEMSVCQVLRRLAREAAERETKRASGT